MKTKRCIGKYGCNKIKDISCFYSSSKNKDGFNIRCIECEKIYHKIKQERKKFNKANPAPEGMKRCVGSTGCNRVKSINKFTLRSDTGKRRNQCLTCQNKLKRLWGINNPVLVREKNTRWRINNPEKNRAKIKKWRDNNPEYFKKVEVRLAHNLRSRLIRAIKNDQKSGSAIRDLGCSVEELKQYIENQFQSEMTWDNWAMDGWHIDHIKPLVSFDLTDRKQFLEACHYTNLQPLWTIENLSKGSKY